MGWTWPYRSKEDAFRAVFPDDEWDYSGDRCRIVDRHSVTEGCWVIIAKGDQLVLGIVRLRREGNEWGEGGFWGEECGPYEAGCPLKWLDRVPEPDVEWAKNFRARVRQEHAEKHSQAEARASFTVGTRLLLRESCKPRGPFRVTGKKGRSLQAVEEASNRVFKLTPKVLTDATPVT